MNIAALRPYKGYGVIRLSENAGQVDLQQPAAQRRSPLQQRPAVSAAYTLGKSEDNGSDKRDVLWNTYDDTQLLGPVELRPPARALDHYIYDLPFWRNPTNLVQNLLGGWQISGATFMRTGTPFSITRTDDIARVVGDGCINQPVDLVGDPDQPAPTASSRVAAQAACARTTTSCSIPRAFAPGAGRPPPFGNSPRNNLRNPGDQQWDIAFFKNVAIADTHKIQFRVEIFNFPNHPNLSGPSSDITNANFGRSTSKERRPARRSARAPLPVLNARYTRRAGSVPASARPSSSNPKLQVPNPSQIPTVHGADGTLKPSSSG